MSGYKYFAFIRKRHKVKYYLRTRFVRKIPRRISFLKRPKWKRLQRVLNKGQRPYKRYFYDLKKKVNRSNEVYIYCKKFKKLKRKFCFHKQWNFQRKKYHRRYNRYSYKNYNKEKEFENKSNLKKYIKFKFLIHLPHVYIRQKFFYKFNINNKKLFDNKPNSKFLDKKKIVILFQNNMKKFLNNYKNYRNLKHYEHKNLLNFYSLFSKKHSLKNNYFVLLLKNKALAKKKIFKIKHKKQENIKKYTKNCYQNIKKFKKHIKISFITRRNYNKMRFKFKTYISKWKRKIDLRRIWPKSKKRPFLHEPFLITRGMRVKKQPKKLSRSFRKNRMHEKATKLDFNMVTKKGGKDKIIRHLDIAKSRFYYMFYKIDYLLRHFNYSLSQYHSVRRMNLAEVNSLQKKLHPLIYAKKDMLITINSSDYIRKTNRKKFFKKWQYFGSFIVHDPYSQTFTVIKTLEDLSVEDLRLLNVKRSFINIHKLK